MWPTLIRTHPFQIGPVHIPALYLASYGVLVAGGYLLAIYWLQWQREDMGLEEGRFWALVYCLFFGAIAGGKLLYVLLEWRRFASGEFGWIRDFRYGFVFYGGFLGSVVMGFVFVSWTKARYLRLADYLGVALPLGHSLGRLGCLGAGCCYGRPTDMPWGVRFTDPRSLVSPDLLGVRIHPTQLYEAAGDLLIAALLWRVLKKVQESELREGTVFFGYIALYAALRFVVEIFRGDDRGGFWLGLSPSQIIALLCAAAAVPLLWRRARRA